MSLKHAAAYVHTHARIQAWRYRGTGSEGVVIWAGWGSAAKCVSHILFPISLSRQDFSLCSFLLEPETTGWALCQVFIFLSFIPPFSIFLLACIGFIAFLSFPHARTVVFHSPSLLFFLFISYLLLFHWFLPCFWRVSPFSLCLISSVLSNGSLGSFPHTVSLFPFLTLSIQPYVSFPCPISLPYRYTWGMKVLLEFFFSPQYLFSSLESLLTLQVMNCVTINMCGIMAN